MASEEWAPYIAAWRKRRRQAAEALDLRVEAGRVLLDAEFLLRRSAA